LIRFIRRGQYCYELQFISTSLIRVQSSKTALPHAANLRTEEIQKAKRYWFETIQSDIFLNEISALARQCLLPENSHLCALNPYFDEDELIRIRGGFCRACLPEATKNLIVLRAQPLLVRIIQYHHLRTLHADAQLTFAPLTNEFWILRSRTIVRSVLHKCISGKRRATR